jgi:hypothetical protein
MRNKGAVKKHQLEAYVPVWITLVQGLGMEQRDWSRQYSAMVKWLRETIGGERHEVLSDYQPGRPDAIRVLFASFDGARAFIEHFEIPIAPIGEHPETMRNCFHVQ